MAENTKRKGTAVRCLCVILALVCAFFLIVLRFHSCEQCDCLLCALQSSYEGLWQSDAVAATFLSVILLTAFRAFEPQSTDISTLVELKVKLSD